MNQFSESFRGISLSYPFPLWPHQREALNRFALERHAYLNHDMGLGKTNTTISLLRLLAKQLKQTPRTVVITPLSTIYHWERELETADEQLGRETLLLTGTLKAKQKAFDEGRQTKRIVILNHDGLRSEPVMKRLLAFRPQVFVADEAHKFKSGGAERTKCAIQIADLAEFVYLLSGTMVTNEAQDVWAQFRLFGKGKYFPENYYEFMRTYFYDANASWKNKTNYFPDWRLNPQRREQFQEAIAAVTHTVKKADALSLPPILRSPKLVPLAANLGIPYRQLERDFVTTIEDETLSVDMAVTKALRLLMLCSGVAKTDDDTTHFLENEKLDALREVMTELPKEEKVIIWTPWVASYEPIAEVMTKLGFAGYLISGEVKSKKRQEYIDSFNEDPEIKFIIANPASLGVGTNLQGASVMIYYAKTYNLEHDQQSEARCHRGNSTHERILRIDMVTAGTIEERVEQALLSKRSLQDFIAERRAQGRIAA